MERTENRNQLAQALRDLPRKEQTAVVEVIVKGQSLRDVASRTGVSAMTVQRRVKRGLAQLRQQLLVQLELA